MTYPPIFAALSESSTILGLLGDPPRIFLFGEATQTTPYPYLVWQLVGGAPENYLGDRPDTDSFAIQVDIYGRTAAEVRAIAQAALDVIEPLAYVTRWSIESKDAATKVYRKGFDVEWMAYRGSGPSS